MRNDKKRKLDSFINRKLIFVSVMHFLVDFLCAGSLVLLSDTYNSFINFAFVFLLYNVIAFLSQPFLGILVDKKDYKSLRVLMIVSAIFLLLGYVLTICQIISRSSYSLIYICATLLGIGNGLFHVIGGKDALSISEKATPGGLFVSTGALGIGLASVIVLDRSGFISLFYVAVVPILLVLFTLLYVFLTKENKVVTYTKTCDAKTSILVPLIVMICVAVLVRSFLGSYASMSESISSVEAFVLLSVAAFVGKAIGGVILDLAGPYFLIAVSTFITLLTSVSLSTAYIDYIFVLSFNMLMPLTLDAIRKFYPNKEGFTFGLTAGFLIPGYLIGTVLKEYGNQQVVLPFVCLITGLMLFFVYHIKSKYERNN